MKDWNCDKYLAAKHYWTKKLNPLTPRDESDEETDALINALEDKIAFIMENE